MTLATTREPRPKSKAWKVGDAFVLGRTRWVIRTLNGQQVECESTNEPNAGIWWTTTLENVPEKAA